MTDLAGVKSSSHNSTPIQVSSVLITASPNGTFVLTKGEHGFNNALELQQTCLVTAWMILGR
jgi:hypothetical protein